MKIEKVQNLLDQVEAIIKKIKEEEEEISAKLSAIHPIHQKSAINLLNYLTFRSFDLRELQHHLGYLGLSRMARAEAHILASLQSTSFYLKSLLGSKVKWPKNHTISIKQSEKQLQSNTELIFGMTPKRRPQRIMVTMPGFTAEDEEIITKMIVAGMNIARINCAHDDETVWQKIIDNIKRCDERLGTETVIAMDIPGPKIRTGELEKAILIRPGDKLRLSRAPLKGAPAAYDENANLLSPAIIACTLPEVFDYLKPEDRIYFDDGIIKGKILSVEQDFATIQILRAGDNGVKLKMDKGINFPDSKLKIHGLTQTDKTHLKFISAHADIVNFSFVNTKEDVEEMHEELDTLGSLDDLGIVYKIETQEAYNNLVPILLEAMKAPIVGVMIARGDLAIESGWNQIGNIQKEMLAICNACHVPIIWATQVLENLAKKGLPSRSEITDAVTATKAECIMLNKGPYILQAIQLLDQIMVNMEDYQDKNAPMLPKLNY